MKLRYAIFKSDAPVAKGTVVLLQGRNESIEKYFETIGELTARGLWVATFDWRGQGGSRAAPEEAAGTAMSAASPTMSATSTIFLDKIVLPDTRLPFFMLAHSMGALIALSAGALSRQPHRAPGASRARSSRLAARAGPPHDSAVSPQPASLCGLGFLPLDARQGPLPFRENLLTSDRGALRAQHGA